MERCTSQSRRNRAILDLLKRCRYDGEAQQVLIEALKQSNQATYLVSRMKEMEIPLIPSYGTESADRGNMSITLKCSH